MGMTPGTSRAEIGVWVAPSHARLPRVDGCAGDRLRHWRACRASVSALAGLPSVGFVIGWPAEHGSALPGMAASAFGFGWALRHTSDLSSPLIPP